VRVLENGQVKGDIAAPKVAINGSVKGAVHASILELATNARVDGDVHYSSIEMMRGAQVNGNLLFSETLNAMDAAKASAPDEAVDEPEKTGETS
ncbi:MAG: polymer-forming cytoskeletal protein, partial [Hyphomicrobiales bacterium]|nr:polymer-forming cytoskeletal protein [Hyphomicrobiales bacterium]